MSEYNKEPMTDMYIFETNQNIEQLEMCILDTEKSSCYTHEAINEIFRIMHTIKGSSAMMLINNISNIAHSIEDVFFFLREYRPQDVDYSTLSDLVLEGVDFIKVELQKIEGGNKADGDESELKNSIKEYLDVMKKKNNFETESPQPNAVRKHSNYISPSNLLEYEGKNIYKATIFFEDGCEMENIRAYTIVNGLREITSNVSFLPSDIIDNDNTVQIIREKGFVVYVKTDKTYEEIYNYFMQTVFLKDIEMALIEDEEELRRVEISASDDFRRNSLNLDETDIKTQESKQDKSKDRVESVAVAQSIISVNVSKLDKLMDLMGEMVIAEAMVTQNPELKDLELDNFHKAARQLHKITSELQDMVMSIRMVPLLTTFHKMHRIVRDMSKKLNKEVKLNLIGEETEVDKNIIEHISDPLMHLVRNSVDHGIETAEERRMAGKSEVGIVTLEARNAGSDVLIIVEDNGKGLNKEKILKKARDNGLLTKPENEMTDREIFNLIFLPGFSTQEAVSEFSGRGVGMDVVVKNIEEVGGSVSIDSVEGKGTTIMLKIPLTLAIIDGMNISVGNSRYTIPTTAIKESFRPKQSDLIKDPDDNEMIMIRGCCYPIIRLHEIYGVKTEITDFTEGIMIMVGQDEKNICIFADELIGQQQVVVKTLPNYIKKLGNIRGITGCTLLGDGCISLILDVGAFIV